MPILYFCLTLLGGWAMGDGDTLPENITYYPLPITHYPIPNPQSP
jgi:hypothetical protein